MRMWVRVTVALAAALLALVPQLWAAAPAAAAEGDLVQLPRGTTYQILEDADSTEIRIPITLRTGLVAKDLTVEMLDVALGQLEQPALTNAFVPSVQAPSGSHGAALIITINSDHGLRAGTYNALLAIRKPESSTTPTEEQRLQLQLSHPSAQLQAPSTLLIERTHYIPYFWLSTPKPNILSLQEITRESRVGSTAGDLVIQQPGPALAGDNPISGRLQFAKTAAVPAGRVAEHDFVLDGRFPLGRATGTLLVTAPQLQSPVTVNFEVRTRLHPIWIAFVALAGILLGWWARVFLSNRIARERTREQAFELLQRIDREISRRPDGDFEHKAREIRSDLQDKLDDRDTQRISTAVEDANEKLQAALNDLEQRRIEELTVIDSLAKDLNRAWSLPPGIQELLEDGSTQLTGVERLLAADNVTAAEEKRQEVEKHLSTELRRSAAEWREALTPLITELASPAYPLDIGVAAPLKASADQFNQQLTSEAIRDPTGELRQMLLAIHNAQFEMDRILDLLPQLRPTALVVAGILETAKPAQPDAVGAIRDAAENLKVPPHGTTIDEERASGIAAAIRTLHENMRTAITAELKDSAPESRKEIEAKLDKGRYQEAAQAAMQLPRPGKERLLGRLTDAAKVADVVGVAQALLAARTPVLGTAPSPPVGGSSAAVSGREREPPLSVRIYRARRALEKAQVIQTMILAVVFSIIAYVLYASTFMGTAVQLGAIFLWAFTSDLAVTAVVNAARGAAPATG